MKEAMSNGKVLIIQSVAKRYRAPFLEKLYLALQNERIQLRVAYGHTYEREDLKGDSVDLRPEFGIKTRNYWFFNNKILFQPLFGEIARADLVIVEQANKYVMNHLLVILSMLGLKKVAFWGHGRNRQARKAGFSEWLKRRTLNRVDWWFAYTRGTAEYLQVHGMRPEKITNVQNSVDTGTMREDLEAVTAEAVDLAKERLGIRREARVGLYCGGLYPEKNLGLLLESVKLIKAALPEFELAVLGDGPDRSLVEQAAAATSWIHYLGPKFGREKAKYFKMSEVFLLPGLVGLNILDAFTAGLPLVTTDIPIHSPEIEYLRSGVNGLMTRQDPCEYAGAVAGLLKDRDMLARMRAQALAASRLYSVEEMVGNFKSGVIKCLSSQS